MEKELNLEALQKSYKILEEFRPLLSFPLFYTERGEDGSSSKELTAIGQKLFDVIYKNLEE